MAENQVRIHHVYSDAEGVSHMRELDIQLESLGERGAISRLLAGTGVIVRMLPPAMKSDWHTAPRRQLIANLAGEAELETGDGQILHIKPGVIEFLEDLTGKGHLTRGRGSETRICLHLPLDDDTQLV